MVPPPPPALQPDKGAALLPTGCRWAIPSTPSFDLRIFVKDSSGISAASQLRRDPHPRPSTASYRDQLQLLHVPPVRRALGVLRREQRPDRSAEGRARELLLAPQDRLAGGRPAALSSALGPRPRGSW